MSPPPAGGVTGESLSPYHPLVVPPVDSIRAYKTNHMIYLGTSDTVKSRFVDEPGGIVSCEFFSQYLAATHDSTLPRIAGCGKVTRSRAAFMKSFAKCDVPPVLPSGEWFGTTLEYLHKVALEYTHAHFSFLSGCSPSCVLEFNRTTSCGTPFNKKYASKGAFLDVEDLNSHLSLRHTPIYQVNDKNEFLPLDDIAVLKLRTVFAPDVVFLAHQKIVTEEANERMHSRFSLYEAFWSRYGLVKQYGGFHSLYKHHARFGMHLTGDGSGWDRVLPLLPSVWALRKSYMNFPNSEAEAHFDYVAENTCKPIVGLPDGSLYRRVTGNCSGSNSTTTDNCIAHTTITYMFVLMLGQRLFGRTLSMSEIHTHTAMSLYGDDSFDSLDEKFFCPGQDGSTIKEEVTDTFIRAYISYGVTVKLSQFNFVLGPPTGIEFLGSTSLLKDGYYYPVPRLSKLCTSITQAMKPKSAQQLATTLFALYDLVSPIPDSGCQEVARSLEEYARFCLERGYLDGLESSDLFAVYRVIARNRVSSLRLLTGDEAL